MEGHHLTRLEGLVLERWGGFFQAKGTARKGLQERKVLGSVEGLEESAGGWNGTSPGERSLRWKRRPRSDRQQASGS